MKKQYDKICLSCQHYHLVDERQGKCRLDKGRIEKSEYPVRQHQDACGSWKDGGQQYFIRVGWIKSVRERQGEGSQRI